MQIIKEKFDSGKLEKKQYWIEMQAIHKMLADYKNFLKFNETIYSIEILKDSLVVKLKNDLKFFWDVEDLRSPVSVAINNGDYEGVELAFIQDLIKDFKIVFDIGANIGWFSLHLSKFLENKESLVYSFEPIKSTFDSLNDNIKLNLINNIKTYNFALGHNAEKKVFFLPKTTGSVGASMCNILQEDCIIQECAVKKLDDFIKESQINQVDFIKCDVEGAELFVLRGALNSLENYKPVLFLEMLRKWSSKFGYHPNDIIDLLSSMNYLCFAFENRNIRKIDKVDDFIDATNYIFLDKNKHKDIINKYKL